MRHQPEAYNRLIEGIVSSVPIELKSSVNLLKVKTSDHLVLTNEKYIRISISTDSRESSYFYSGTIPPDYSFNHISIKIERRGIRNELLSEWINDGTVNYDRINQAINVTSGRINALIEIVDDFIEKANYVVGHFNKKEIELFKEYNLHPLINHSMHDKLTRIFEWKTSLSEGHRVLNCKKEETGYILEITEKTVLKTIKDNFGNKIYTPSEVIFEIPEGVKDCDEFMKLFSKIYEYYFG